jgi:hypothetical protein
METTAADSLRPAAREVSPLVKWLARLGMLLSYIRWRPKAIWALSNSKMAYYANMPRWGYAYQERGFLRWQFQPGGASESEWLSVADRASLERLIREVVVRRPEYRPG